MKGGGRKEPPVGGEVTCKRPKRKCLQWHPLLSKKALDFSEEEEEEDEEELEKVSARERLPPEPRQSPTVSDLFPAGRAVPPGAGLPDPVWKHNRRGGGGLQRATGEAAHERLPPLLQTPPVPGAPGAPSPGQSRGHQDLGRLVGGAGTQREAEIHRHGEGGETALLWSSAAS